MLKLFRPIKANLRNPNFYTPISHLHKKPTSKYTPFSNPAIDFILNEATEELKRSNELSYPDPPRRQQSSVQNDEKEGSFNVRVQISHPWPEWVGLMEKLLKGGYFDQIGHPFGSQEMGFKDFNQIRTACLNLARDRFDLIR